jgi:hypothetical protein
VLRGDEGVSPGLAKPLVQTDSRCDVTLPPLLNAEAARFSPTVFAVGQQSRDYFRFYWLFRVLVALTGIEPVFQP